MSALITKKQLLEQAKTLNIAGRHEMTVDQLRKRIAAAADKTSPKDKVKQIATRHPSPNPRDNTGKVIRAGRNLSGNSPFKGKFYYLDPKVSAEAKWTPEYREAEAAAPMQVRLILKHMRQSRITERDSAEQGGPIVEGAITKKVLVTKIPPENLFAYYRRVLETLGVIHAEGFDPDGEAEE